MCSRFYQWYLRSTNTVQGSTNDTIGNTIGTNGNVNATIGSPNGTIVTNGKPMVPLVPSATNGTIGKITNDTIGRTPNGANIHTCGYRFLEIVVGVRRILPVGL